MLLAGPRAHGCHVPASQTAVINLEAKLNKSGLYDKSEESGETQRS